MFNTPGGNSTATAAADGDPITCSTTVATLIPQNRERKGGVIYNGTGGNLYVRFAAGATTILFSYLLASGDHLELPGGYCGIVTGIMSAGSGPAYVTEF